MLCKLKEFVYSRNWSKPHWEKVKNQTKTKKDGKNKEHKISIKGILVLFYGAAVVEGKI